MTADRSTPLPALFPAERPSATASGFADLLGDARAASSRPGAYAASSRPQRAAQDRQPGFVLTVTPAAPARAHVAVVAAPARGGAVAASARAGARAATAGVTQPAA